MTRLAFSRCLTSRYDDGSSNMYMSAFWHRDDGDGEPLQLAPR